MPIRHPGETSPIRDPREVPPVPPLRARRTCAFTLVELLVVIGIIVLLVALLLPVLGKARASSQTIGCLSNLRQIMMGFHLYAGDHGGRLPDPIAAQESWESQLRKYLTSRDVYHCQSDGGLFGNLRSSYDWRDTANPLTTVAGKSLEDIRRSNTVFVFDALPEWHAKRQINTAYAGGSTQTMGYQECLKDLDTDISIH